MSNILYVCHKSREVNDKELERLKRVSESINPDNISSKPSIVYKDKKIAYAISNPNEIIEFNDGNVLLGQIFGSKKTNWWNLEESDLDGNFVIFRKNDSFLEIKTDVLASRAVWIYQDDEMVVASSSQISLVKFLGDFQFNENVIPWMIANGMLGPSLSWDKRLMLLSPDTTLIVDRKVWSVEIRSEEIEFIPREKNDRENVQNLNSVLSQTFEDLNLDYSQWKLSLSGGYDSRGNVCFLPKEDFTGNRLSTITWGLRGSEKVKGSDAEVAQSISDKLRLTHFYYHTNFEAESLEVVLNRFLRNGEGRIDRIGGYIDGFNIWQTLYENEIKGVIRGDEVFGSYKFVSDFHLKRFVGISLCSDYVNLKDQDFLKSFDQSLPVQFTQKESETFEQWRDRLYQSYLVPIFLSSLSNLKDKYIEQINPFLSKKVVEEVRRLPDHLRTDKKAFKAIVDDRSPIKRYATSSSTRAVEDFFEQEEMVALIKEEFSSEIGREIFPSDFISFVTSGMRIKKSGESPSLNLFQQMKRWVPKSWKRRIVKKTFVPQMDMNLMAFRMFMIIRMVRILREKLI